MADSGGAGGDVNRVCGGAAGGGETNEGRMNMEVFDLKTTTFLLDNMLTIDKACKLYDLGVALVFDEGRYVTIVLETEAA